jgi:predicted N-acetyltransferase YhbS
VPELDYVAEIDGKLVGHIIYSKSKIAGDDGLEHEMLTFGPLSVHPDYQRQGIGEALVRYSIKEVKKLEGYDAILIFGHPEYYPRLGFKPGEDFSITDQNGNYHRALMLYELYPGALERISGKFVYHPVYNNLPENEVEAFDKKFPPKEKKYTGEWKDQK